jgi:transcriptional regulator with XRE-family HTH domain
MKRGIIVNQEKIGKFIANLRKEKNMTQQELAKKLGVTDRAISKWENGRGLPDYSLLQDLCDTLSISINELFSGEKISKEDYKTKAEENMSKLINDNYSEKKKINWIIAISVAVVYLSISILFDIWAYSWIIWVGYSIYRFIKK